MAAVAVHTCYRLDHQSLVLTSQDRHEAYKHVPTPPYLQSASAPAAHIPLYLYPFLNTGSRSKPFEYLRLTSLGVIGALVKVSLLQGIEVCRLTCVVPGCKKGCSGPHPAYPLTFFTAPLL